MKLGPEMAVVTGSSKPAERGALYKNDIIFSTPQTARNDIKNRALALKDFSLCIIDEAHRCVGNYAYVYVARKYMEEATCPLILALTASPGSHAARINDIKRMLFIINVEVRQREDSDVKPYVQKLKQSFVEVELPLAMKSIKSYMEKIKNERIRKLIEWKVMRSNVTKTELLRVQQELMRKANQNKSGFMYAALSVIAEVLKLDHAIMLLETQSLYSLSRYFESLCQQKTKAVARLLNNADFKSAVRLTAELLAEGKEHPKMEKLKEIVSSELAENKDARIIVFAQYRDTIKRIEEALRGIQFAAPIAFIGQAKRAGTGLSQKEQAQILNEFRLGFHNILLATQIGEEGLDIEETSAVIFYEPVPSAIRSIQRSGRTARTQPGKVFVLITKCTRDVAYRWSSHRKEQRMKSALHAMQRQNLERFVE